MAPPVYRRYVLLPELIHMLAHRALTLRDPSTWDDTNDSYFLRLYQEKKKLNCVFALCLSTAKETYHHWNVFAKGAAGVCVWFHQAPIDRAAKRAGAKITPVTYLTLADIKRKQPKIDDLPFLKRSPYRPEEEIRLLWESKIGTATSVSIHFDLDDIERITVSPWLHESLVEDVKAAIGVLSGESGLDIRRSTITSNASWKRYGENVK